MHELEEELTKINKIETTSTGKRNACKENMAIEQRKLKQLQKSIEDDERALGNKESEMEKVIFLQFL